MWAIQPTYIQSPFTLSYSIAWLWVSDDCLDIRSNLWSLYTETNKCERATSHVCLVSVKR